MLSNAKPMDWHEDQLLYVGVPGRSRRLQAYERQNGHDRLTSRQNKRYWKKQRRLIGRYPASQHEVRAAMEWASSRGKGHSTSRRADAITWRLETARG